MTDNGSLNVNVSSARFRGMIGTGGIGSGSFFALRGDHTLGREESRMGRFIQRKDYCKLHIISHYVKTLIGEGFRCLPIGKVGDDETGKRLVREMEQASLDTTYVTDVKDAQTLYCICFIYPDESGGNLTVEDSASSQVTADDILQAEEDFKGLGPEGIALGVPEVPLEARLALFRTAKTYGLFTAASFITEEIVTAGDMGFFELIDFIALNSDEAASLTTNKPTDDPEKTALEAVSTLQQHNKNILASITAGSRGSWAWDGTELFHTPALQVEHVKSTAGAGDAHMSGILAGLCAGLDLSTAQKLGTVTGALSVTSPHTINRELSKKSLKQLVSHTDLKTEPGIKRLMD